MPSRGLAFCPVVARSTPLPPNRGVLARPAAIKRRRRAGPFGSGAARAVLKLVVFVAALFASGCGEAPLAPLRVGMLEFGTVAWEMAVVRENDLARKRGVALELVTLPSEAALAKALAAGRVDVIVSDWLWAARQRAAGREYQFAPYSLAVGAVMVNPGAGINSVPMLAGHKLGVPSGPLDKTWLLLRAYAEASADIDLESAVTPVFAAPPALNRLMLAGELPAAVNYWHYNARLQALGMDRLITVERMLAEMGVATVPPLLGWIFKAEWADANAETLRAFLRATYAAKALLAESDTAWEGIRELVKPESRAVFAAIKARYRAGIPRDFGAREIAAARQLFQILAAEGGAELTGGASGLPGALFWDGFRPG